MNSPLVSIIIPCCNAEKYVKESVQSALNQTYNNIEIICVNDGSTDGTLSILQQLASRNEIITVLDSANRGGSAARNLGFSKSRGEYIQFLDADDILENDKIDNQLKQMEPSVSVVISDYQTKDCTMQELITTSCFKNFEKNPLYTTISLVISTNNPIYRRSVVEKADGYDESLPSAQDWDFHLRLVLANVAFKYVPGIAFTIRRTENSVSSNWLKVSNVQCDILLKLKNDIIKSSWYNKDIEQYICRLFYNTIVHKQEMNTSKFTSLKDWCSGDYSFISQRSKRMIAMTLGLNRLISIDRKRIGVK